MSENEKENDDTDDVPKSDFWKILSEPSLPTVTRTEDSSENSQAPSTSEDDADDPPFLSKKGTEPGSQQPAAEAKADFSKIPSESTLSNVEQTEGAPDDRQASSTAADDADDHLVPSEKETQPGSQPPSEKAKEVTSGKQPSTETKVQPDFGKILSKSDLTEDSPDDSQSSSAPSDSPRRKSLAQKALSIFPGKRKGARQKRKGSTFQKAALFLENGAFARFTNIFDDSETVKDKKVVPPKNELSPQMAAIFMVSVTTGYAMSTLPHGLKQSNWYGVFMIILFCVNLCYSGLCFGWTWVIMEERWPKYEENMRTPYQDMAEKAVGMWMRYVLDFVMDFTILSTSALYLMSIANSVEDVSHGSMFFCAALIVASVVLMPFVWFRSYKDIKFIGILDLLLSFAWVILGVVTVFLDPASKKYRNYSIPTLQSLTLAFSEFSFAYSPGAAFPTIMVDMQDRGQFTEASTTACLIVLLLYAIPSILVMAAYGDDTPSTFSHMTKTATQTESVVVAMEVVFLLQILTTFVLMVMPALHSFESLLKCPETFDWKRVSLRSSVVLFLMLLVLAYPGMGLLIGAFSMTGMTLLSFFFPPIFYVCLMNQSSDSKRFLSKKEWLLVGEMVVVGLAVVCLGSYYSVKKFVESKGSRQPCFINFTATNPMSHERARTSEWP